MWCGRLSGEHFTACELLGKSGSQESENRSPKATDVPTLPGAQAAGTGLLLTKCRATPASSLPIPNLLATFSFPSSEVIGLSKRETGPCRADTISYIHLLSFFKEELAYVQLAKQRWVRDVCFACVCCWARKKPGQGAKEGRSSAFVLGSSPSPSSRPSPGGGGKEKGHGERKT